LLRHCAASRKVAGYHLHNPGCTVVLGSTHPPTEMSRVEMASGGTRRSTGGEVKGKEANGVGSLQSCTVSEHGLSSITTADAHTSAASRRLN